MCDRYNSVKRLSFNQAFIFTFFIIIYLKANISRHLSLQFIYVGHKSQIMFIIPIVHAGIQQITKELLSVNVSIKENPVIVSGTSSCLESVI